MSTKATSDDGTVRQRRGKKSSTDATANAMNKTMLEKPTSPSTTTTTVSVSKPSTTSSSAYYSQYLGIVHVYSIIWCIHYYMPLLDVLLSYYTKEKPFRPWKTVKFIVALDHRSLIWYDYIILYPLITSILSLYGTMYIFRWDKTKPISLRYELFVLKLMFVAHVLDFINRCIRMPYVWDHEQWAMLCNTMFVMCYMIPLFFMRNTNNTGTTTMTTTATTTTTTSPIDLTLEATTFFWLKHSSILLGTLYIYAAFWKLTTSFVYNTNTSCGSSLVLETLVTYYLPNQEVPTELIQFAVSAGPHLTFFVESFIGLMMIYVGYAKNFYTNTFFTKNHYNDTIIMIRNIGVIVTSLFHITISMLPVNAAGGFSLDCMTRLLFLFHPYEIYHTLYVSSNNIYTNKINRNRIWFACFFFWVRYKGTGYPVDFGFLYYCIILDLYIHIMYMDIPYTISTLSNAPKSADPTDTATVPKISSTTKILSFGTVLYGLLYGIGMTVLGLQQMGAPTMYSNLRSYYGGNHLIVPTGVLGDNLLYGGGLLQILYSTCDPLNQMLGYINAADIVPAPLYAIQKAYMRNTSIPGAPIYSDAHIPMQFLPLCISNPHSKELLFDYYRSSNPIGIPAPFPFILPINAVQRAIQKAMDNNNNEESIFIIKFADGGQSNVLKEPPTLIDNVTDVVVLSYSHATYDEEEGDRGMLFSCHVEKYGTWTNATEPDSTYTANSKNSCEGNVLAQKVFNGINDDMSLKMTTTTTWFMSYIVYKFLNPYPQIINEPEEVCMS